MLTELESCILGVIWRGGPMSAYDVRSHFARSTTATWSSSTGTVYPAIRRLREAALVDATPPQGPRRSEVLSLTGKGRDALEHWLSNVTGELGASTADPIRTRVHFLAALPHDKRKTVLEGYVAATGRAVERLEAELQQLGETAADRAERLGTLGAISELRARLDWLETIGPELRKISAA
jgi:DNA-binding PadR family transcriptional regulator